MLGKYALTLPVPRRYFFKKYYFFIKNHAETGELTQRLRAFVLADDLGSIISTHMVAHDPL